MQVRSVLIYVLFIEKPIPAVIAPRSSANAKQTHGFIARRGWAINRSANTYFAAAGAGAPMNIPFRPSARVPPTTEMLDPAG
jgi:hypothetical protein